MGNHQIEGKKMETLNDNYHRMIYVILLVYCFIGGLWIYFSDELIYKLSADPNVLTKLQTFKGWFYIIITTTILYIMINRFYAQVKEYYYKAIKNNISLKLIFDHVGSIIWTVDRQLRFTSSYGSGLSKLNLRTNEVVGRTLYEYFRVNDNKFLPIASHIKAFQGNTVYFDMEWQGNTYHCHLEPLKDESGEINSVIGIAVDITERKQMEDRLKSQLNELLQWKNVILEREERIMELKKEINDLLNQIGKPARYSNV